MRDRFLRVPFASGGDTSTIPDATQPTGSISMQQGWGGDYQKEMGVDPGAKSVDRQDMNELFNIVTALLNRWQTESFPEWIDPASNAGTPYPYPKGAVVRYSATESPPFVAWMNTIDDNATEPSALNGWILFESVANLATDPTETTRGAPLLATQAIAEAGTDNKAMMSALRVVQLIRSSVAQATTTLRGVMRLSTVAEALAGTNGDTALTPKVLKDAGLLPLGVGQSIVDVTALRAPSVNYTNESNRSIAVIFGFSTSLSSAWNFTPTVDGKSLGTMQGATLIVPPGKTYSYVTSGAVSTMRIHEVK